MSKEPLEKVIITIGLVALTWLSSLSFGSPAATDTLDASWTQALGYAFKHHFQAGIDYIFTFGPLGYVSHPQSSYDADLFYVFITWQIIMGLFFSLILVLHSSHLENKIDKVIYFFLVIVIVSAFSYDPRYILGITACVSLTISPSPVVTRTSSRFVLFLGFILWFLAVVSWTKFPNLILASVAVFSISVGFFYTRSRQLAIITPVGFTILLLGTWLASGQSLTSLPSFIKNSLQITSAYSEAMSGGLQLTEIKLAIAVIFLVMVMTMVSSFSKPLKLERVIIAGMVLFSLFLAWKASFVRHDAHSLIFFTVAVLIPFFIGSERNLSTRWQVTFYLSRYLAIVAALSGLFLAGVAINYTPRTFIAQWNERLVDNYKVLTRILSFKNTQDNTVATLKQQFDLPKIRTQVGSATVDIFSWEQGVLFLNGLNWHPRPVFQSYAAYTSSLMAINGDFYADKERAPKFVIFKLQEIDGRFPVATDTEALKIILRDYQPLFSEKGYLLLKQVPRGQGRVPDSETLLTRQLKIGEALDIHTLNDQPLLLSLDIRKSLVGHLSSLLYRFPNISLEIETTDGPKLSYRIIPRMTQSSFIITPLILNQADFIGWYTSISLKRATTLRVVVNPEWLQYFFKTDIAVKISKFSIIPPSLDEVTKKKVQRALYPMLYSKPSQVSSPNQEMSEAGQAVLMVHAPGEMRFQVSPGKHTLTGQFGILADAYNGKCPPVTDGVEFSVVVKEAEKQERVVFKRFLNPRSSEQDRGIQILPGGIIFAVAKEATVQLLTQPGPANDAQCDWSFWKGIRIE